MATGYFKCENDEHDPRHAAESLEGAKDLQAAHHCGKWRYHHISGNYDEEVIQKGLDQLNKGGSAAPKSSEPNQVKPGLEKPASKGPVGGKQEKEE